jgi:hypothetical protein
MSTTTYIPFTKAIEVLLNPYYTIDDNSGTVCLTSQHRIRIKKKSLRFQNTGIPMHYFDLSGTTRGYPVLRIRIRRF